MCYVQIIMAAVAVVASVAQSRAQNKAMKRQQEAIDAQNRVRAQEIDDSASAELNERARAARRARASARAAASESGINLSSGSFLAKMQSSAAQQDIESGLVTKNKNNRQSARQAEYQSALSGIRYKTGLGIALDAGIAGANAYFGAGGNSYLGNNPGRG